MIIKAIRTSKCGTKITKEFDVSYVHPYYLFSEMMYGVPHIEPQVMNEYEYENLQEGKSISWENGSTLQLA